MSKFFMRRGVVLATAMFAVVLGAMIFGSVDRAQAVSPCGPGATPCINPNDVISIRHSGGNPGPYGGGTVLAVPVGGTFLVELWVDASSANYQGYQWEIAYDPTYLVHTGNNTDLQGGTYSLCAGAGAVPFGPFIIYGQGAGCLAPGAPPPSFIGEIVTIEMKCIAATSVSPFATAVVLVAASEDALNDPIFGTSLINPGGALRPTSTRFKGPNPAGGNIAQIAVVCFTPADISIVKTDSAPDPSVAPGSFTYNLAVSNNLGGAQTANVSDTVPAALGTVTAASAPCTFVGNVVTCNGVALPASPSTVNLTITVTQTAAQACASASNTATVALTTPGSGDINPANNTSSTTHAIACTNVSIVKSALGSGTYTTGDPVTYNWNVCNAAGASTATGTVVTDSNAALNPIVGSPIASLAAGGCTLLSGTTTFANPGTYCNTATADPGNGTQANATSNQVCVTILPPFNGITKDTEPGFAQFTLTQNVWLCKNLGVDLNNDGDYTDTNEVAPTTIPGQSDPCGQLIFDEVAFGQSDVDTCNDDDNGDGRGCNRGAGPDGVFCTADDVSTSTDWDGDLGDLAPCHSAGADGICYTADDVLTASGGNCAFNPASSNSEVGEGLGAFEFQIKFDHKLFQHPNIKCLNDGPGGQVLDDTGRTVMGTMDIITENWVLVGCVSKANADGDAVPGENPPAAVGAPESGAQCTGAGNGVDNDADGVADDGCPSDYPDPGPSIGQGAILVRVVMDVQPDLLSRIRPTKDNGVRAIILDENCELADTLGSPYNTAVESNGSNNVPNGGLSENCDDITATIRMLEGDVNLDCKVTVVDDQMMAFRYGATFGVLAYDKFFDLEPNTTPADFDVDIKDLQFVFGRNGSTCASPIPNQPAQPAIPDP